MAEEFDIFAGSMKRAGGAAGAGASAPQGAPKKKFHRKPYGRGASKANNSPLRGANGEESVNPLLNAPLPTEQKAAEP